MAENKRPGVTKKAGTITEQGIMIQNISIRPVQRAQLDIQKWRTNHQNAEGINGTRVALYDLYSDVLLDGFLKRLVAKRILSVTKNHLKYIDKSGKEIEGAEAVLNLRQFRKLRQRIQLYKAWGIAVIELMNDQGVFKIFDAPKKHILPKEGKIVLEQYGIDGIEYRMPPYSKTVIEVGDYDDLGYLLEACAYVIYKRGNIADWANYAQTFGMPFREARYDGFNEQVRLQLENALEKAGSAAFAVLPRDAELIFHEMKNSAGAAELYNLLRTAMNEELSVLIIGATETTTSSKSSGYAQSETHLKTVDEVAQDDKEDELSILNESVIPVMVALGLLQDGGRFVYDEPVDVDVAKKKIDIAKVAKDMGVPISDDYIYAVTGIPKPTDYESLKAKIEEDKVQAAASKNQLPAPGKKTDKKNPAKPGDKKLSTWEELRLTIADFFDPAQ